MDSESKSETETYDNAKPEMETTFSNPWNVSDLSDFLRYCCPECDYKCEEVQSFCNHAKGHLISEQIYEVIVSPKIRTKYFKDFCPSLYKVVESETLLYQLC